MFAHISFQCTNTAVKQGQKVANTLSNTWSHLDMELNQIHMNLSCIINVLAQFCLHFNLRYIKYMCIFKRADIFINMYLYVYLLAHFSPTSVFCTF